MADVFISYKSEDREHAERIANLLHSDGYSVWWDQSLVAGSQWSRKIKTELDAASCVVVLWTENSVAADSTYTSEWVENESEEGKKRGILVPVLLHEDRIPWTQRVLQYANLVDWAALSMPGRPDHLLLAIAEKVKPEPEERAAVSLDRSELTKRQLQRMPNAFAVISGRPGSGQSWLASSLACSLSRTGKRVLLVDLAGPLAVTATQMLGMQKDFSDTFSDYSDIENAAALIENVSSGLNERTSLDVFRAVAGSGPRGILLDDEYYRMVSQLPAIARDYGVVLFDLGSGFDEQIVWTARACSKSIVLVTDQPISMTDTYALLKVMRGYAPTVAPFVVVNRVNSAVSGKRTYETLAGACQQFMQFRPTLAGVIVVQPDDKIIDRHPSRGDEEPSPGQTAIRDIATKIGAA